jgi:hypothetical protein
VTFCKHIGGAVTDVDNDCLADASDADTGDNDQDNDGLLDGVDATYLGSAACPNGGGSPITTSDCDGDGNTDAEEMMQPTVSMTNPRVPDTDGDGFLDSGLRLDCDGNGAPDSPDLGATDTTGNPAGRNRVMFNNVYCKPWGTSTGLGGRPVGNPPPPASGPAEVGTQCDDITDDDTDGVVNDGCSPAPAGPGSAPESSCLDAVDNDGDTVVNDGCNTQPEDNCPGQSNVSQLNSSTIDPESNSNPADGTNGRFGGSGDTTHVDAKYTGDACDGDDDNDGVADSVEGLMFYDASGGTGEGGQNFCNTLNDDTDEEAAVTSGTNRDSDFDSASDGVECQLATKPHVLGATPPNYPSAAFTTEQQIYYRLIQLAQVPPTTVLVTLDDGSLVNGTNESKAFGAGAASSLDTDRDGCPDETELTDTNADRLVNDSDRLGIARAELGVSTFAPAGSAAGDPEERRTADVVVNGVFDQADRLGAARIALSASLATQLDYNLNCTATSNGYNAN